MRKHLTATICATASSLFFTVVLPLQTYLGNKDMFEYSIWDIVPTLLGCLICVWVILFLMMIWSERFTGYLLHTIILVVSMFYFLEVGVLSFGMPALNGNLDQFHKPTIRKYLDVAILCWMVFLSLIFYKRIRPYLVWIGASFLLISICSVFDANKPFNAKREVSAFSNGFCPLYDVFASTQYASTRNVIMFVLDATPGDIATQIFESDATLRDKFKGFVDFKENIGVGEKTIRGVPTLATGKILEKDDDPHDFLYSFWGDDSFFNSYLVDGYAMYIAPYIFGFGYTNRRRHVSEPNVLENQSRHPFLRYTREAPFLTFMDVLKIRMSFYRYKLSTIQSAMSIGDARMTVGQGYSSREEVFFRELRKVAVDRGEGKAFLYYHLCGVHFPITTGRHGEPLSGCINDGLIFDEDRAHEVYAVIRNRLHYILEIIGDYFDFLRAEGVYDSSTVVITCDHGIVYRPKSALLLVKPAHSNTDFIVSDLPTSHERIAEMMRVVASKDIGYDDLKNILTMKVRRMRERRATPDKWWEFGRKIDTYEIKYDEKGNEISCENMGEFNVL